MSDWQERLKRLAAMGLVACLPATGVYLLSRDGDERLEQRMGVEEGVLRDHKTHIDTHHHWLTYLQNKEHHSSKLIAELLGRVAGPDGEYDATPDLLDRRKDSLERIVKSMVIVHTQAVAKTEDQEYPLEAAGSAVVMQGRYLFTVNHVVDFKVHRGLPDFIKENLGETTSYLQKEDGSRVVLEPVVRDPEYDVAVFRIPEGIEVTSLPYPLGKTEDLRLGDQVYLIGNPGLRGWHVREGIVSRLDPMKGFPQGESLIQISPGINPGDSGSLVVAMRDGVFEVIGFPKGKFLREEQTGFIVGVSQYMGRVLELLEPKKDEHRALYESLRQKYA